MGFETPKTLSPEEMSKIQKERTLSDAELLQGGAEYVFDEKNNFRLDLTEEQKNELKEGATEKLYFALGNFPSFDLSVKTINGKVTKVLENIDVQNIISYDERNFNEALSPFIDADIEVAYRPWTVEQGEDIDGYVFINKDDINQAISENRIKITQNPEGDLVIE